MNGKSLHIVAAMHDEGHGVIFVIDSHKLRSILSPIVLFLI